MRSIDLHQLSSVILRQAMGHDAIDQRIPAIVHYVIAAADTRTLGYVKLNMILWHADLEHYRWHGMSMTGLRHYSRTLHGPMSQDIVRAVGYLVREGKVEEPTVTVADYKRREMVSLEDPDVTPLTDEQIDILDQVIRAIGPLTAAQLTRMNREDTLWNELENNEAMPVATGSIVTRPLARY